MEAHERLVMVTAAVLTPQVRADVKTEAFMLHRDLRLRNGYTPQLLLQAKELRW